MPRGARALNNPFGSAVGQVEAEEYDAVRPTYPDQAFEAVLHFSRPVEVAVDVGAGTGQFTRGLVDRGIATTAVEPSAAMRSVLESQPWAFEDRRGQPLLSVVAATAENTGLASGTVDTVVWAQCSHWLNIPQAAAEAARILRPGGGLNVAANQLAVEIPWVHRLSRIMRSGDVVRRDRMPDLGNHFEEPVLTEVTWGQDITVEECLQLARTRSSYLGAPPERQKKMQSNLRWYLLDHLGFDPQAPFMLPYTTLVWSAHRAPARPSQSNG